MATQSEIYSLILQKIHDRIQASQPTDEITDDINDLLAITDSIRNGYQFSEVDLQNLPQTIRNEVQTLFDALDTALPETIRIEYNQLIEDLDIANLPDSINEKYNQLLLDLDIANLPDSIRSQYTDLLIELDIVNLPQSIRDEVLSILQSSDIDMNAIRLVFENQDTYNQLLLNMPKIESVLLEIESINEVAGQISGLLSNYYTKQEVDARNITVSPPLLSINNITLTQNQSLTIKLRNYQNNYVYSLNDLDPTKVTSSRIGDTITFSSKDILENYIAICQVNVTVPNVGTSEYENVTINLNYVDLPQNVEDVQAIIFNGLTDIDTNDGYDYNAPNITANKDNASLITIPKIQGNLTLTSSTISDCVVTEDISSTVALTGKIYILNDENTSDYIEVACTVLNQTVTYDTPLTSPAIKASDETKWKTAQFVAKDSPKSYCIDSVTTTTEFTTTDLLIEGDEIEYIIDSNPNGVVETLGTVTTSISGDGSFNTSKVDYTPPMTSASQDGFVVTVSSALQNYEGWRALDSSISTEWLSNSDSNEHITIKLDTAIIVNKIGLMSTRDNGAEPNTFEFQLSNTGAFAGEEVVFAGATGKNDWVDNVIEWFTFTNTTPYKFIRVFIISNNGLSYTGFTDIRIVESTGIAYSAAHSLGKIPTKAFKKDNIQYSFSVTNTDTDAQVYTPLTLTRTYNATDNNFDVVSDEIEVDGRALRLKVESNKASTIELDTAQINLKKEA